MFWMKLHLSSVQVTEPTSLVGVTLIQEGYQPHAEERPWERGWKDICLYLGHSRGGGRGGISN